MRTYTDEAGTLRLFLRVLLMGYPYRGATDARKTANF